MGIMSGIGGLVGGLSGLFGGGANNVQLPQMFQMPNMGGAANNAYGGIGQLSNWTDLATQGMQPMQTTFGNLYNNPYAGGFLQGAGVASGFGQNQALGQYGVGGALTNLGFGAGGTMAGMGGQIAGYANPLAAGAGGVLNSAFDPQSQLYAYLQQQNTDQSRANAAAAGLATSPYGVGLANQSNQLFNMGWQNQQLGREVQGLGAAQGAYGQAGSLVGQGAGLVGAGANLAGNLATTGQGLQAGAPGQYLQASSYPYGTYAGIGQGQNQAIQSYFGNINSGLGIANLPISDYLSYLGIGNQANATANQTAALGLQQQQQNFNQQMMLGGMLGGSMYGLGRAGFPGFQNNFGQIGPTGPGTFMGYSTSPTFGFG